MNHFLLAADAKKSSSGKNDKSGTKASNDWETRHGENDINRLVSWWCCYKVTHHRIIYGYNIILINQKSKRTFPNFSLWVSSVLCKENLFRGNLPSPHLSTWKYFLPVLMHNKVLIRRGYFDGPEWWIATIITVIGLTSLQLNLLLHQISFSLRENYQLPAVKP